MKKRNRREALLEEGLRVFHDQGYIGATVRDICRAAGAPLGSFTNYFSSKEQFALEILGIYDNLLISVRQSTILNNELPPLKRFHAYLDVLEEVLIKDDYRNGCLIGNFCIDSSNHSEALRNRLNQALKHFQEDVEIWLVSAVESGTVNQSINTKEFAANFVSSLYGALMMTKVERSPAALRRFKSLIDSQLAL